MALSAHILQRRFEKIAYLFASFVSENTNDFGFIDFVQERDKSKQHRLTQVCKDRYVLWKLCHICPFSYLQYIRLAFNTSPETIAALLIQAYRLPVPDFILSINTGGIDAETYSHAGSSIPLETQRSFQRGLAATVATTRRSLVTQGLQKNK